MNSNSKVTPSPALASQATLMVPGPKVQSEKKIKKKNKKKLNLKRLNPEEQRLMIEEKMKSENLNKMILKGARNRNNPAYDLNRAG